MLKDYSRGKGENINLHVVIDWDKVSMLTLNKEEELSELRLEDLSQKDLNKKRSKSDYIRRWSDFNYTNDKRGGFFIRSFFPSRKIYIDKKEVWVLKINGDTIIRSGNYDDIKRNYDHFYNEWRSRKKQ